MYKIRDTTITFSIILEDSDPHLYNHKKISDLVNRANAIIGRGHIGYDVVSETHIDVIYSVYDFNDDPDEEQTMDT